MKNKRIIKKDKEKLSSNNQNMNLAGIIAAHWEDVAPKEMEFPGFSIRSLWSEPGGRKVIVFEIAPGAVYPILDVHTPGAEEVFVISGVFCDGKNSYPAGTFIHHPAGSSHIPQSKEGCKLLVLFPEG